MREEEELIEDTIAAIATPPGEGGIGIVRISGPEALRIGREIFRPRKGAPLGAAESHRMRLGLAVDPQSGEVLDEVLAVAMRGPHSYTAEDVVEVHCHGGPLACARVLQAALRAGARLAEPGEFTRRAFLNGRLDLAQAEAIISIIRARSQTGLAAAISQLQGGLSRRVKALRDEITGVLAAVEASLDFPEEVGDVGPEERERLVRVREGIQDLLATWEEGRLVSQGINIALVGRPNVGKSSLLNALLREDRAIVSDIPGTTRDTISEAMQLGGFPCQLIDTAGMREAADGLERLGIARSRAAAAAADLVLLVVDLTTGVTREDEELLKELGDKPLVVVANKADAVASVDEEDLSRLAGGRPWVVVSAKEGQGLDALSRAVRDLVLGGRVLRNTGEPLLLRERHREALERALGCLEESLRAWEKGLPLELVSIDLQGAWEALGEITGETAREDLLDRIFSEFCLGK
ncbi:tRNA uridine-5-carboxymethylaminomethyl(34) synthesis GTPase MnmE [Thermanaeromonas sp. C210]|uniref:tRNA uridine-5-carboxymethylaminomethyl(34) synthesis GTPase MnmE n=1 Tax=Thermanaeromonas sp. C210 TaxID=2731925 RepID=UPI00155C4384|nr:tRNA uridine-5-carboxymethylaminomethyl(34) synthesis GTPase MnmE [Thermanaeromonas sp. C210]GFN23105.1 tRNA modification GTPase MnmE [Thermanaeromonas sp. C210]